jgi:hypothetical protein
MARKKASSMVISSTIWTPTPNRRCFKSWQRQSPSMKIDRRRAVARCFASGLSGECTSGDYQAFVSASHHCASKVPHNRGADRSLPSLALEEHLKRYQVHAKNADAVDAGHRRTFQ